MAMKFLDMTGKTEEEAISKALAELGLDRDDVSVEILERAKRGLFGIGASPAKVRVTYGLDEPESVPVSAPVKREEPAPAPQPRQAAEKKPAPEKKASDSQTEERRERPERRRRRGGDSRPRQERPVEEERGTEEDIQLPPPADLGEPCDDEKAQQIRSFLTGLLEHMDKAAAITIYQPEKGRYKVFLEGEKMGQLIGRRGETLDPSSS